MSFADGSESLRGSLERVAGIVGRIARERGDTSVSIGEFTGPPAYRSNAGPGIQWLLRQELQKAGMQIKKSAPLGLQGRYALAGAGGGAPESYLRLNVELLGPEGERLRQLSEADESEPSASGFPGPTPVSLREGEISLETFVEPAEAAALLGATWDFEREGLSLGADKSVVARSLAEPTAFIDSGVWLKASSQSPYALQVAANGQPLRIQMVENQPFVELRKGASFRVIIRNSATHDISAQITLDGVNSFAFAQERKPDGTPLSRYIVQSGRVLPVQGWHKTQQSLAEFKVTDFSRSAAAILESQSGIGVISLLIRASWTPEQGAPKDEPQPMLIGSGPPLGSSGIGLGVEQSQSTRIATNRESGVPRAVLSIRYARDETGLLE